MCLQETSRHPPGKKSTAESKIRLQNLRSDIELCFVSLSPASSSKASSEELWQEGSLPVFSLSRPKPSWVMQILATGKLPVAPVHVSSTFRGSASLSNTLILNFVSPAGCSSPVQATRAGIFQKEVYRGCGAKRQPLIPSHQGVSRASKISWSQAP